MPKRAPAGAPAARVVLPQPVVTGVTTTLSGRHQARIKIKGKRYDLGSYDTFEEAQEVYANAKRTGQPERGYLKRETNPMRKQRGTGTPLCFATSHTSVVCSDCLRLAIALQVRL